MSEGQESGAGAAEPGSAGALQARASRRRVVWVLVGLAAAVGLLVAALLGAAWWHFRSTPDFASYVAAHPVAAATADGLWIEAERLGDVGNWSLGEVDALALAPDDPACARRELAFTARILHGEEVLLDLEQLVVLACARDSGVRRGLALSTRRCTVAPGMRAWLRAWVPSADELVGPEARAQAQLTFDVALLAGAGEERREVVRRTSHGLGPFPPDEGLGFLWFFPTDPAPGDGLVHRLRQGLFVPQAQAAGSRSGFGVGDLQHAANTRQYSYRIEAGVSEEGFRTSWSRQREYTWNGEIW